MFRYESLQIVRLPTKIHVTTDKAANKELSIHVLIRRPRRVVAYLGAPFFSTPFARKIPFCLDLVSNKTSESVSLSDNVLPDRATATNK